MSSTSPDAAFGNCCTNFCHQVIGNVGDERSAGSAGRNAIRISVARANLECKPARERDDRRLGGDTVRQSGRGTESSLDSITNGLCNKIGTWRKSVKGREYVRSLPNNALEECDSVTDAGDIVTIDRCNTVTWSQCGITA
jgi:hypothetical protein